MVTHDSAAVRAAGLALAVLIVTGCARTKPESARAANPGPQTSGIGCVGRILPEGGTFFISAAGGGGRIPVISEIRIHPGDWVRPGQVVAVLSSRGPLEEALRETEARLALAEARVARVKAGANPTESAVIHAEIVRLQQQRDAAARDVERNRPLLDKDYISRAQMDALEARVGDADALIAQARERLNGAGVVRSEDVTIAEREASVAANEVARARTELETATVRAAAPGRILSILAHPGEPVGPMGIAEVANTSRMVVMAEVYEADIARVREGSRAMIRSALLPAPITGRVAWIAPNLERQQPLSTEPGAPSDARIFKVKIEVPDQSVLAQRINGKVDVVIEP